MFVIGRGVEFSTAREIALKLLETCRVAAEPLTATDLAHGPVAALDPLFPVWAIASDDGTLAPVQEAAARIREMGATLVASGTAARMIEERRVPRARPDAESLAALPPALRDAGPAVRRGARPLPWPRRRRAARPRQGDARPLTGPMGVRLRLRGLRAAHPVEERLDGEALARDPSGRSFGRPCSPPRDR